jgi:molecular chaperone GrpE
MTTDPKNPQQPGPDRVDPSTAQDPASHAQDPGNMAYSPSPAEEDFAEIEAALSGQPRPKHHDDIIMDLRRENADLRDRVLRAQADVENIRKRSDREKDETAKYAVTRFARDVLGVADNMQRAISAVPAGAVDQDPALKSLVDGVNLTERELINVMERHGVRRIAAENAPFNPHLHQAVMEVENPNVPAGTVVQVFQSGFSIGDRVLRPAMVVVSRGGSTSAPPSDAPPASDTPTG